MARSRIPVAQAMNALGPPHYSGPFCLVKLHALNLSAQRAPQEPVLPITYRNLQILCPNLPFALSGTMIVQSKQSRFLLGGGRCARHSAQLSPPPSNPRPVFLSNHHHHHVWAENNNHFANSKGPNRLAPPSLWHLCQPGFQARELWPISCHPHTACPATPKSGSSSL